MKLPLSPDELAKAQIAATKKPLPNHAATRTVELIDWCLHWRDALKYQNTQIDCIELGRAPASLRQQFYDVRGWLRDYPELTAALNRQYKPEDVTECKETLTNCHVSITENVVKVTRVKGGGLIAATKIFTPQTVTLRARFELWLGGDMTEGFEALGEALTKEDILYFEMKVIELKTAGIDVTVGSNSVIARRLG